MILPRYPVYVISKGRHENPLTANSLKHNGVPFKIVVEPQERDAYAAAVGAEHVAALPFSNLGLGSIPARNWVWEDARSAGHEWHWILDDNIRGVWFRLKSIRMNCRWGLAMACTERLVGRYQNVGIGGLDYAMFCPDFQTVSPFSVNCHVYSCLLIRCGLPFRWRGRYNEDTDLCLQSISSGWCTIQVRAFSAQKVRTMTMKGGNMEDLYRGDGRLRMAKSLERMWPGIVSVERRYGRPQHVINWKKLKTPLVAREGRAVDEDEQIVVELRQVAKTRSAELLELMGLRAPAR